MFAPSRRTRIGIAALAATALTSLVITVTPARETVADFVDREFSTGVFSAATWNLQGSTDRSDANSGTWDDHFSDAATLTVTPTTVDPWTKAYSPFSLRLAEGSIEPASVTLDTGLVTSDTSSVVSKYRVRMVLSPSGACNAAAFTGNSTYLIGTPDAAGAQPLTTPASTPFPLSAAPAGSPGAPQTICVESGISSNPIDNSVNGTSITVQWTFNASST